MRGNFRVILRSQIEHAIKNTKSNSQAAKFLGVHISTYKKYASIYRDEATGKNLYELHSNPNGVGINKKWHVEHGSFNLNDILAGKHPDYSPVKLKRRLVGTDRLPLECFNCGQCEQRITDGKRPLILDWIDGDRTNHKIENLRYLCFNCYFLLVGNIVGRTSKDTTMMHCQDTFSLQSGNVDKVYSRPHPLVDEPKYDPDDE